jgi:hypothetical protein
MKSRGWTAIPVLGIWALTLCAGPQATNRKASPTKAEEETTPLVRRDLLDADPGRADKPLRDLFHPKSMVKPVAPAPRPAPIKAAPATQAEAPTFALNLTYVGSVASSGRILALVMVGGQTLPVAVGEEVAPGYKILRITPEAIEVAGPNDLRKTFSRQGVRP